MNNTDLSICQMQHRNNSIVIALVITAMFALVAVSISMDHKLNTLQKEVQEMKQEMGHK